MLSADANNSIEQEKKTSEKYGIVHELKLLFEKKKNFSSVIQMSVFVNEKFLFFFRNNILQNYLTLTREK